MRGNNTAHTNYLQDQDGNTYYINKEKCIMMEQTWRDVCRITEEEENTFDIQHSQHIEAYIQIHNNRIKAYDTADLTRLDDGTFYTRQITIEEVKNTSQIKNKAPGSSKINKTALQKLSQ